MDKYHVALSFAGEDREYVDAVANSLRELGVNVFYDQFEETALWGKDLYTYLSDVYQNRALYTVMFVSEAYATKLWTNHERQSAQARAFSESKEYILPAVFDRSVEVPGLLKTTGYISLENLPPADLAKKILEKLRQDGVVLTVDDKFHYSVEAKSDVDFPLSGSDPATKIVNSLKSNNWYTQSPSIEKLFSLNFATVSRDQLFVLGRNIYQCACGNERRAVTILKDLRREMARLDLDVAEHLLNGMFYEVYFDSKGEFRRVKLKNQCLDELFEIQTATKFSDCLSFIRKALAPYRTQLAVLPNSNPELAIVAIEIVERDPPLVTSVKFRGSQLILESNDDSHTWGRMWTLSYGTFTIEELKEKLATEWAVPIKQISIEANIDATSKLKLQLPDGKMIGMPFSR